MRRARGAIIRIVALLTMLLPAGGAWAHASLLRSEPPDGAVWAQPPPMLRLIFNEPVSPLIMRLIGPGGEVVNPPVTAENATVTLMPPRLRQGTHVLSWRVISADGHPVGGSVMFSIGQASAGAGADGIETDPAVKRAFWLAKFVLYLGLFIGIGGAAFAPLLGEPPLPIPADRAIRGALMLGIAAAAASLGLQGLDALALPLTQMWRPEAWSAGFATSYGATAVIAVAALTAGLASLSVTQRALRRGLAVAALAGIGLALAVSGHAGTAGPPLVSRPSVFLHAVAVAFWIGSLFPLFVILRDARRGRVELQNFSRAIPLPLAILAVTGVVLCFVQLDRVDALWTTQYGEVLACKLCAVVALLALAALNRYRLVPRLEAAGPAAVRPLAMSIAAELVIACAILALVALWRFTPPPRALAAVAPVSLHIHGERAMTNIEVEPVRGRGATFDVLTLDSEVRPLKVKEVTLMLSNPAAGIEPVRRAATATGDANWRVEALPIPLAGKWTVRVEVLINDFEKVVLEDDFDLPRAP